MTDVNEKNGNGVSCKIIHRKCLLKITVTINLFSKLWQWCIVARENRFKNKTKILIR
jgi:hypothetical protein